MFIFYFHCIKRYMYCTLSLYSLIFQICLHPHLLEAGTWVLAPVYAEYSTRLCLRKGGGGGARSKARPYNLYGCPLTLSHGPFYFKT